METLKKIRLLIGDDDPMVVAGIQALLENHSKIELVGEIPDPAQTQQLIEETAPDILVMDLAWWDEKTAGLEQIQHVRTNYPQVKIIAITAYDELIDKAKQVGAHRTRKKGFTAKELVETILGVYQNEFQPQPLPYLIDDLTDREITVLELMASGLTDREISDQLSYAETTIKANVRSIISKLMLKIALRLFPWDIN